MDKFKIGSEMALTVWKNRLGRTPECNAQSCVHVGESGSREFRVGDTVVLIRQGIDGGQRTMHFHEECEEARRI